MLHQFSKAFCSKKISMSSSDDDKTAVDERVTRDGRLCIKCTGALCVPKSDALRTRLIRECHDSATAGHLGRDKTAEQMQRRFFWHGMTTVSYTHLTLPTKRIV